ncbi:MAG: class I SAM-dependent methyltransferase [Nitrospirae bacterium]|nr:class I SAM-dependent methyltransferase [Nitrospirota bacterium]
MDSSEKDPVKTQTMFTTIAHRYDFLNMVLSLGIDRSWRRFAISQLHRSTLPIVIILINKHCQCKISHG